MKLPLSPRLRDCCSFVAKGDRVADIGCDHGYLGISLLLNGTASFVIASDINRQPLQSAVANANKYGVADRMSFHLSDGARSIPHDFDTLVCAGMGADTMISILEGAAWLRSSAYRLILQCQSKVHMLRQYLSRNGFSIRQETVLRDGRFLYTVMEVIFKPAAPLTPGQCYFSPALSGHNDEETAQYYRRVVAKLRRAIAGCGESADPFMATALQELEAMAKPQWFMEENDDEGL